MKVKELIELLKNVDQEAEINLDSLGNDPKTIDYMTVNMFYGEKYNGMSWEKCLKSEVILNLK